MNPSTAAARELVSALVGHGVRHVVLCPGSRSAPLAYALHACEAAGLLTLHVRFDERSAGFCALGVGKADPVAPAAVVTTSGTAVANLHPAVLEAHHAQVPLLVVTADRPHDLRGTWANQTSELQAGLFGDATRATLDLTTAVAADRPGRWAQAAHAAVRSCRGLDGGPPGPVHLDVAFDDPLTPDDGWAPQRVSRASQITPEVTDEPAAPDSARPERLERGPRTVVVAGDGAGPGARLLAEAAGWPLLAEPSSGARSGPNAVGPYRLLLEHAGFGHQVERVVGFGRPTLSRPVTRLLARADVEVVLVGPPWAPGPARTVRRLAVAPTVDPSAGGDWLRRWRVGDRLATRALDAILDQHADAGTLTGPLVAREVAAVHDQRGEGALVVAASNPVRDLDLAAHPFAAEHPVLANRGLSGIDGTLGTAVGVAAALGRATRLLVGDLAFLHDLNGLAVPAPERDGLRLQVVVLNDDGGGIFGLLEHGEPERAPSFERVFGTPHGADVAALCAGLGIPHQRVETLARLRGAIADVPAGVSVVEVRADRARLRELHRRIRSAVHAAIEETPT